MMKRLFVSTSFSSMVDDAGRRITHIAYEDAKGLAKMVADSLAD